MKPNGITHVHAITLQTFDPNKLISEKETIFVPDWMYHTIRTLVKTVE